MLTVNINKEHIPNLVGLAGLQSHPVWVQLLSAYARAYQPPKTGCHLCRPSQGAIISLYSVAGASLKRMDSLNHALLYTSLCREFKSREGMTAFSVNLGAFQFTIDP